MLLHADAVAGAVDEVLAEAGVGDHLPGRPVDLLARRADRAGLDADALRLVQHRVGLGDLGGRARR